MEFPTMHNVSLSSQNISSLVYLLLSACRHSFVLSSLYLIVFTILPLEQITEAILEAVGIYPEDPMTKLIIWNLSTPLVIFALCLFPIELTRVDQRLVRVSKKLWDLFWISLLLSGMLPFVWGTVLTNVFFSLNWFFYSNFRYAGWICVL